MFSTIMVPVDLAHQDSLRRALDAAASMARLWNARMVYVGVSASAPGPLGHTPEEYAARLAAFAEGEAAAHEVTAVSHPVISHDPVTDVDDALLRAVDETGADLVVMASHLPRLSDHFWPSNGGKIATHAKCSVMIVRG